MKELWKDIEPRLKFILIMWIATIIGIIIIGIELPKAVPDATRVGLLSDILFAHYGEMIVELAIILTYHSFEK